MLSRAGFVLLLLTPLAFLLACQQAGDDSGPGLADKQPSVSAPAESPSSSGVDAFAVVMTEYDGETDDLLSAGLGWEGLRGAPPKITEPLRPSPAELRRLALYHAYRGLMDLRPEGEFARWRRADGKDALAPVAGQEFLVARKLPGLLQPSAVLLQIPRQFNWRRPCLVAAATSGSRGIYGAIPVLAHWALPHGCAIVYSEKGTGNGIAVPALDQGYAVDGQPAALDAALFQPGLASAASRAYQQQYPNRIAFRHAHSGDHPERHWGEFLIDATHFAMDQLNQQRPTGVPELSADNTIIMASGISNGGGAAIAAIEADDQFLFDAVVVAEPNVQTPAGRPLYDYSTEANVYASCAVLALDPQAHPLAAVLAFQAPLLTGRCQSLASAGLLDESITDELPVQALQRIHRAGYPAAADPLLAFAVAFDLYPAIAATYAHAYGQFPFHQPPCEVGFAYAGANGQSSRLPVNIAATLFAASSGVPPTVNIQIVRAAADGQDRKAALVPATNAAAADGDLAAALCHRALWTGSHEAAQRVQQGINEVMLSGDLRGRPGVIVHGSDDSVVPVVHSSRPYVVQNSKVEGENSRLRYVEIEQAQHFDALVALPAYSERYVPLHPRFLKALDDMWVLLHKEQ